MQEYLLSLLNYVSFKEIFLALLVFILTMIIKSPIKVFTSKLDETKRKAINSIIVLIPITLSSILNILYGVFFFNPWSAFNVIKSIINSWLLSLSIYAIYERLKILIKAFLKGEINSHDISNNETFITNEIVELIDSIQTYQNILQETQTNINCLKDNTSSNKNLYELFQNNIKLKTLNDKEKTITKEITELKAKLENIQKEEI